MRAKDRASLVQGAPWRNMALLALLLAVQILASGADNNSRIYMSAGTSTSSALGFINYDVTRSLGNSFKVMYSQGPDRGSTPQYISYQKFDFRDIAPYPTRFCASGKPQWWAAYDSSSNVFFKCKKPDFQTTVTLDSIVSSWSTSDMNWNNQPSLSSYIDRVTANRFRAQSQNSRWYYVDLTSDILNNAVHANTLVALRQSHTRGDLVCWHSQQSSGGSYKAYIAFDYTTCDANAHCSNSACVCNPGYSFGTSGQCEPSNCQPATLQNAQFPFTNSGVTATGTCLPTFQGAPKSLCTNRVWGAVQNQCTKRTCPADASAGFASFPLTNAGTSADGVCLSGYKSSGPRRTCSDLGVWSEVTNPCTRITCPATTIGTASFPQVNSQTTASGTCVAGYSGSPKSDCTLSGTWGPVTSPCTQNVCAPMEDVMNNVDWPSTPAFSTAMGTCFAGYSGNPQRTCSASGSWALSIVGECMQLSCPAQTEYSNADWPLTVAGLVATGVCRSGYSGNPTRSCEIYGSWSPEVSSPCTRNYCPADSFENASWPALTPSNTIATGTCVAGYSGSPTRACSESGTWASTTSRPCVQVVCAAGFLDQANWPVAAAGTADVNGTCTAGYSGPAKRSCLLSGEWGSLTAVCTRNICSGTTEGNAVWAQTNSLESVAGQCIPGFSGAPTRSCNADGVFGAIVNTCTQIKCPATVEQLASWPASNAGSTVVAGSCNAGLSGTPTRSCGLNGAWGGISGSCVQLYCPASYDAAAKASWVSVKAGTAAVAGVCDPETSGFPTRSCSANGTWSAVNNACSSLPCAALFDDHNADWEMPETSNVTVFGTCVTGFASASTPSRLCDDSGRWGSDIADPCLPTHCTDASPSYGSFFSTWPSSLQSGSSVSGTCVAGYQGSPSRSCSYELVWSVPEPACEQIWCPSIDEDGHASWPSMTAGSTAGGSCMTGYRGDPVRACSITGEWGTIQDPCTIVECSAVTESTSSWPRTTAGAAVTGSCHANYYGTVTRVCSMDGLWGAVQGTCEEIVCDAVTENNIEWTGINAGSVAVGRCLTGYGGETAPTRSCTAQGIWSEVTGSCDRLVCAAVTFENAEWPSALSMTNDVAGVCASGWHGSPRRNCSEFGTFSEVRNPCVQAVCPALSDADGDWPSGTPSSSLVAGTCPPGFTGEPLRQCTVSGTWSAIENPCVPRTCAGQVSGVGNPAWPTTEAGRLAAATCEVGFAGSPSRLCDINGNWEGIINPCVRLVCPAVQDGNADWPAADANLPNIAGECMAGFFGTPSRACDASGNWGQIQNNCDVLYCPQSVDGNANWNATGAGLVAVGSCVSGYAGTPVRVCQLNGAWNSTIENPCQIKYDNCPSETVGMTYFPSTAPGMVSVGTCPTGYEVSESGPPMRTCTATGEWEASFENPCTLLPVESGGLVYDLAVASRTSNSVKLMWQSHNVTNETSYRVEVGTAVSAFQVANTGGGINLLSPEYVVVGLSPNSQYSFRVTAGLEDTYSDLASMTISAKTEISPPGALRLEGATNSSLSFGWTASAEAEFYRICYVSSNDVRDASDGFIISGDVPASEGIATIENLEPGVSYVVLVLAGLGNTTESTGSRTQMSTVASSHEATDPGLGVSGTIIAGASAGAVVFALILVVIVIILIRRQKSKTKEKFERFGGETGLQAMRAYREERSRTMLLGDSNPSFTMSQMSVGSSEETSKPVKSAGAGLAPYLQCDFSSDLQVGSLIAARHGRGSLSRGRLLAQRIVDRVGYTDVVVEELEANPALSDEENGEVFLRELDLMWSLSFHQNIVALAGYTLEPRTIIVRSYPINLHRYLHKGEKAPPLESPLLHFLGSGVAAGLHAIHSMNIAHRGIKSTNILLNATSSLSPYPVPVIADFHDARGDSDPTPNKTVSKLDIRYASPELIIRYRHPGIPATGIDDRAADMFALGVVLWELYMRMIPWGDASDDEIETATCAHFFMETPPPTVPDDIRSMFVNLINGCTIARMDIRMTAQTVHSNLLSVEPSMQSPTTSSARPGVPLPLSRAPSTGLPPPPTYAGIPAPLAGIPSPLGGAPPPLNTRAVDPRSMTNRAGVPPPLTSPIPVPPPLNGASSSSQSIR